MRKDKTKEKFQNNILHMDMTAWYNILKVVSKNSY